MVNPTISGITMERRDQVLMGRLLLVDTTSSTFFARWISINGPFFTERGMVSISLPGFRRPAPQDHAVGTFIIPRLVALGGNTPRTHRVTATRSAAFSAAMRVIH